MPSSPDNGTAAVDASTPFPGASLQTTEHAAAFLDVSVGDLIYGLYRAPDETRYRHFEIPKRSGGMRLISSPNGMLRDLQYKLLPVFQQLYSAHPAAHGFIPQRGVVSNATPHASMHLVLNIDLQDFFPAINFGRVRGLFMNPPFSMGPKAATIFAQICTYKNGLPQGAPTSPVLSNFIAASLDRRLLRLARENKVTYTRYADDITFSTNRSVFPPALALTTVDNSPTSTVIAGEALEQAVHACGFSINTKKVRLQGRAVRQSVTGLSVNVKANIQRSRVRQIRAMLHAWQKFGLDAAAADHFARYSGRPKGSVPLLPGKAFRNIVYGHLSFMKMVRGNDDPVFLKLCAKLIPLDPNPSKFIRQMVFGAEDFDVFISHASEDKAGIARPVYEACERFGIKAFLDEEHIAWGKSFTEKINTALGAARTVLAVVTQNSVTKEWPLAEINSALAFEVSGEKSVVVLLVGKPDLSRLPLIKTKKYLVWNGDADHVARELKQSIAPRGLPKQNKPEAAPDQPPPVAARRVTSVPSVPLVPSVPAPPAVPLPPPVRNPPPLPETTVKPSFIPVAPPPVPQAVAAPVTDETRRSLLARLLSVRKLDK